MNTTPAVETLPRPAVTPDRVREFLALYRDLRKLQVMYRRTQDPMLRREVPHVEDRADMAAELLARDLDAADAEAAVVAAIAEAKEGGAP